VSEDLRIQCGSAEYQATRKLGIIGVLLFPIGIPVAYLVLLCYFRVPQAANILKRNSQLRQLVDIAFQRGIEQPDLNIALLTCKNIAPEHLDLLYKSIFLKEADKEDEADEGTHQPLKPDISPAIPSEGHAEPPRDPYAAFLEPPEINEAAAQALAKEIQIFIDELYASGDPRALDDRLLHTALYAEALLKRIRRTTSRRLLSHLTGAFARSLAADGVLHVNHQDIHLEDVSLTAVPEDETIKTATAAEVPVLLGADIKLDALELEVQAFITELRTQPAEPKIHHERMLLTALYTEALLQRSDRASSMQLLAQMTKTFSQSFPDHAVAPAAPAAPRAETVDAMVATSVDLGGLGALHVSIGLEAGLEAGDALMKKAPSVCSESSCSESVSSADSLEAEIREELEKLTRHQKLDRLLKWIRSKAMPERNTWREMQKDTDPRRKSVNLAIGVLFEDYFPDVWFWKLYEVSNKLVITSALSFIAPGSTTQIIAGLGISFFSLLVFLRFLPYPKKTIRQLAYTCNLVVFLFFFIALLLRFDTTRTLIDGDVGATNAFYSIFVIALWVSIPLTLFYVSYASGDLDTILITGHAEEDSDDDSDEDNDETKILSRLHSHGVRPAAALR
jgi:hypothetical protein